MFGFAAWDEARAQAQRERDVAVGGIAGCSHGKRRAAFEQGDERKQEPGRRSCRDDNPLGRDVDRVGLAIEARQAFAERGAAHRFGVAEVVAAERLTGRLKRLLRRPRARLARLEVKYGASGPRQRVRAVEHVHGQEGIDAAAVRGVHRSRLP